MMHDRVRLARIVIGCWVGRMSMTDESERTGKTEKRFQVGHRQLSSCYRNIYYALEKVTVARKSPFLLFFAGKKTSAWRHTVRTVVVGYLNRREEEELDAIILIL
jgi:hypothetical protein